MDLTINGKLVKVLEPQSGTSARGNWTKQSFIIETIEPYPKKICLIAWNERTAILKDLTPGDELKISISIESREYNGRWYTDVRANTIDKVGGSPASVAPPPGMNDAITSGSDYPTTSDPSAASDYPTTSDPSAAPQPPEDELPF